MVHSKPSRRGQRGKHGLVRFLLAFCAAYLDQRFGPDWCLSPEQSLSLHAGNWTVPRQLMVRSAGARNKITKLPHGTSLFDLRASLLLSPTALKKKDCVFFRRNPR